MRTETFKILEVLRDNREEPWSSHELAVVFQVEAEAMAARLRKLSALGLVRKAGSIRINGARGRRSPLWTITNRLQEQASI